MSPLYLYLKLIDLFYTTLKIISLTIFILWVHLMVNKKYDFFVFYYEIIYYINSNMFTFENSK